MIARIDTDLPGNDRARAWLSVDAIVVEHAGIYTVATRAHVDRHQLAEMAAVLTEASQP
ncbi:MAG TPA: hypothetical protein VEO01_36535 [Pseudonocardiaceae bacterium]|nr:hypothetical protein [Pseudonocardiaceae bacterium]